MELQGVTDRLKPLSLRLRALVALTVVLAGLMALLPSAGRAAGATLANSGAPVLVTVKDKPPPGYRLTATQVERIAAASATIRTELHKHPTAIPYEYTKGSGQWQVSWFSRGPNGKELAQVYVNDTTGEVTEAWTGFQVAWTMARGYSGAFGRRVNALYVWLPLCALFVAPFFPWRRRPSLLHLDLLILLGFSISLALFDHGTIGLSVPLVYPFLLYLLVRMLLLAIGRGVPREPLRLLVPASWLAIGVDLPGRLPDRAQRQQLERDRRRLRRRDRRRQGPARQAAVRKLAQRQRQRGHLRPGQLLRLCPVPRDLRLERHLG